MSKPAPSPETAAVIAKRSLKVAGSRRKATVTLRLPVKVSDDEWQCAYEITGNEALRLGYGVDAFQALSSALAGIRRDLNNAKDTYTWFGEKGDHGFLQLVAHGFGLAFDAHIEQVIERESVDHYRALMRQRRQRRRDAKRKGS